MASFLYWLTLVITYKLLKHERKSEIMSAKPYVIDITTSTTASSTALPEGLKIVNIANLDGTNNITVSFDAAVGTANNPEATLTPANDTINYADVGVGVGQNIIYWSASASTPILRIIGYIS